MKRILFAPEPPLAAAGGGTTPAPAPAPAAPAAATAAPSPATPAAAPEPTASGGDNPFADLDRAFKAGGTDIPDKPAPKEPAGKPATPAPVSPKPGEPEKKVGAPGELNWNSTPKQFRERKEALEKELETKNTSMATLEAKLKDYEAKGKDTELLLQQIDAKQKQIDDVLAENRMLKQESSPEFKAKYDVPFDRAATYAERVVTGLEKADGQPATWDDFAGLYGIAQKSLNRAIAEARATFGDNAGVVIQQLTRLHELNFEKQEAMKAERANWQERTKADEAKAAEAKARDAQTRQQRSEEFKSLWKKVNTDLEGSVKEYAVPVDDKELNEARTKGLAIVDTDEKDFQKAMPLKAHIRQRAAMFTVNQIQIARLTAEVDRLKKALDDKNPSPPDPNKRPGGHDNSAPSESWEEGARRAVSGV